MGVAMTGWLILTGALACSAGYALGLWIGHGWGYEKGKLKGYLTGITEAANRAWAKDDVEKVPWTVTTPPGPVEIQLDLEDAIEEESNK